MWYMLCIVRRRCVRDAGRSNEVRERAVEPYFPGKSRIDARTLGTTKGIKFHSEEAVSCVILQNQRKL